MTNLPEVPPSHNAASSRWDEGQHIIKVVRCLDGTARLVRIENPLPWVLRKRFLSTGDID